MKRQFLHIPGAESLGKLGGSLKTFPRADTRSQASMGALVQCRMRALALLTSMTTCRGEATAGSALGQSLLNLDTSQERGRNRGRQTRYVYCLRAGALPSGLHDSNTCHLSLDMTLKGLFRVSVPFMPPFGAFRSPGNRNLGLERAIVSTLYFCVHLGKRMTTPFLRQAAWQSPDRDPEPSPGNVRSPTKPLPLHRGGSPSSRSQGYGYPPSPTLPPPMLQQTSWPPAAGTSRETHQGHPSRSKLSRFPSVGRDGGTSGQHLEDLNVAHSATGR